MSIALLLSLGLLANSPATLPQPTTIAVTVQKTAEDYYGDGMNKMHWKDYNGAITSFDQAIKLNPNHHQAWYFRGYAYQLLKQYDKALTNIEKANELAQQYGTEKDRRFIAKELETVRSLASSAPTQPVASKGSLEKILQQGRAALEKDDLQTASNAATEALKLNYNLAQAQILQGDVLVASGQAWMSIPYYDQAIKLEPSATNYLKRGLAYDADGKLDKAAADYTQAVKLNPKLEEAFVVRGSVYTALKKFKEAETDYSKAIALNPRNLKALEGRSFVRYSFLNDTQGAMADLKVLLKLYQQAGDATNIALTQRTLQAMDPAASYGCRLSGGAVCDP